MNRSRPASREIDKRCATREDLPPLRRGFDRAKLRDRDVTLKLISSRLTNWTQLRTAS